MFENFDHFGRYFDVRYGLPVQNTAVIKNQTVSGAAQLSNLLLQDEARLSDCLFRHFFSYASGYSVNDPDIDLVAAHALSGAGRYQFQSWVQALISHPRFRLVRDRK